MKDNRGDGAGVGGVGARRDAACERAGHRGVAVDRAWRADGGEHRARVDRAHGARGRNRAEAADQDAGDQRRLGSRGEALHRAADGLAAVVGGASDPPSGPEPGGFLPYGAHDRRGGGGVVAGGGGVGGGLRRLCPPVGGEPLAAGDAFGPAARAALRAVRDLRHRRGVGGEFAGLRRERAHRRSGHRRRGSGAGGEG